MKWITAAFFYSYITCSFAFEYQWKQISQTNGTCYLKGLDENLIEYANITKNDNCFTTRKFIWKMMFNKIEGKCLRVEGNKTFEVFYTNCKKNIKTISKWETIQKVGFCFNVDEETLGIKYKIKTNDEACFPRRKSYLIKSNSKGKGICYMVDKDQTSNFKYEVPFIFCKKKIINNIGRAPAIIPSDSIEDSSRRKSPIIFNTHDNHNSPSTTSGKTK